LGKRKIRMVSPNLPEFTPGLVYHALARRSQHSPGLWSKFNRYLTRYPLPRPKIIHRWYAATPTR